MSRTMAFQGRRCRRDHGFSTALEGHRTDCETAFGAIDAELSGSESGPSESPRGSGSSDAASATPSSDTTPSVATTDAPTAKPDRGGSSARWLGIAWSAGAAVLLLRMIWLRLLLGLFCRRRIEPCSAEQSRGLAELAGQLGLRRPVRVVRSAGLRVPVAFGWRRPTVGVPAGFFEEFDPRQQRAMLAHELAHLAGGDTVWQALSDSLCALLWWHPAAWWSRSRLQAAAEAAADEASLLVPDGPGVLAECLVALGRKLSRRRRLGWVSIDGPGFRSALGRRVERLLQLDARSCRPSGPGRAASVRFVLPVLLVLAAVFSTAWARPRETSSQGEATMNVWQSSVGRSMAAAVLWALVGPATDQATADEPPTASAAATDNHAGLLLAQRDGDRERAEGERRDGDREVPEARRDREEGERDHPEARRDGDREREEDARRDGDREHPERAATATKGSGITPKHAATAKKASGIIPKHGVTVRKAIASIPRNAAIPKPASARATSVASTSSARWPSSRNACTT